MPLLVHGEVTDPAIDVFDREAVFVERVMKPLRRAFAAWKVVFEHITTKEGAEYVRDAEGPIAATITPQHLLYNRNAIFLGGVRPHWYCLPILKRETHRQVLVAAATSGPRFFLGTDSAACARPEGACLRLRWVLHRPACDGTLRDCLRRGGRAGQAGRLRQLPWPGFLRAAAQYRQADAGPRNLSGAGRSAFRQYFPCRWPPARYWPGALRSECRAGMAGRNDPRREKALLYI